MVDKNVHEMITRVCSSRSCRCIINRILHRNISKSDFYKSLNDDEAWEAACSFLRALPTGFAKSSSESRLAVAGVIVDSINAGCAVGAGVVNTIVDV